MKLELTKKEIKLIKKALLNHLKYKTLITQNYSHLEQRTWESIYDKIDNAEISEIIKKDGLPLLKPINAIKKNNICSIKY
jgi:predicted nucleotidyltransferase